MGFSKRVSYDKLIQLAAGISAAVGTVADGIQYGWTSPVVPKLEAPDSNIKITNTDVFWLENIMTVGALIGLYTTVNFLSKIGPKKSILLSAFIKLIGWILIGSVINIEVILLGRFINGLCANVAFVSAPMYIGEISNRKIRGLLSSVVYIMMLIGILLVYTVAPFVSIPVTSCLAGAFVIIQLIAFPFMPESPYFYISKNKMQEARTSLQKLRYSDDVEDELLEIKAAVERQKAEAAAGKFADLFKIKSNRKALTIMTVLNASQHLGGISVMIMNVETILSKSNSIVTPTTGAILFSCLMLVAAFLSSVLVDVLGRKVLLVGSSLVTGIALLTLAIYFSIQSTNPNMHSWVPLFCVMLYALAFKCGLGMVPIVTTAELFPSSIKAFGMAMADISYVIFSFISILIYQTLATNYGLQYPFYIFAACCIFTIFFTIFYIPETKGKSLEEIQMILKDHTSIKNGRNGYAAIE